MADKGFVPNFKGYREALNDNTAYSECDHAGREICSYANMGGHGSYDYDTIHGRTRVHTRVRTADEKSFFQEKNVRRLARLAGGMRH